MVSVSGRDTPKDTAGPLGSLRRVEQVASTRLPAAGEGTYRFRPWDGLHEWRSPHGFPVKKTLYAKNKKALFQKVRQFYRDVDRGVNFDAQKLTLSEYLDQWLESSVEGSVWYTTARDYERQVRLHIKPALGNTKLQSLTKMHVQRLINQKTKEGYSPRAVRYVHTTLSKALSQAVDWDLVTRNVASRVKLPRMTRTRRETLSPGTWRPSSEPRVTRRTGSGPSRSSR